MKPNERIRVAPGPLAKDVPIYHTGQPRRRIEPGDEVIVTGYHLDLYHQGLLVEFVEPPAAPVAAAAEVSAEAAPAAPAPEPAPAAPATPAPAEAAPSTPEGGNA